MTADEIERKHQEDLERIRNFRLLDDDFMTKCFDEKPEYIQLVLRIIMGIPDLEVVDVRTQVFVENLLNRSVRLDVKAHDTRGKWMNVEIQRKDHGAGRKRARYNSSMMDVGLLEKGADFEDLPEVWVIFITENDVIGRGDSIYQFERCDIKTGDRFNDGSHILYVNGSYRGNDDLGKLMHDFSCTNPSDMIFQPLAERVRFFKESKEGVAIMCKAIEDMRNQERIEGIQEGILEGEKRNKRAVALRMLKSGKYTDEEIAEMSGLSIMEVKKLKEDAAA